MRTLENDYQVERVIELMHEQCGIIKNVAKHLGCSISTLYKFMESHPEVQKAQREADERLARHSVELAYEANNKLIENFEADPTNAFKAISLVLKGAESSRFHGARDDVPEAVDDPIKRIRDKIQDMDNRNSTLSTDP